MAWGTGPGPLLSHVYVAPIDGGAVSFYDNCLDLWNGTYQLMWSVCAHALLLPSPCLFVCLFVCSLFLL
jgi:hypothetical protein